MYLVVVLLRILYIVFSSIFYFFYLVEFLCLNKRWIKVFISKIWNKNDEFMIDDLYVVESVLILRFFVWEK